MSEIEEIMPTNDEPIEDLPMEQKKKAINLQDLIYVKAYINLRHNTYKHEMDGKYADFVAETTAERNHFKNEYEQTSADLQATYDEFMENVASGVDQKVVESTEEALSNVTRQIDYIKNGTTTVGKASNATKVQNIDLTADTTAQFGNYIVSKEKLVWSGTAQFTYDGSGTEKGFKLSAASAPAALLTVFDRNRKYRIVLDSTSYVIPHETEIKVSTKVTSDSVGANVIPFSCGDCFILYGIQDGDFSAIPFYFDGQLTKDSSGNYGGTGFALYPLTARKDTVSSFGQNSGIVNIKRIYEIVE